MFTGTEINNLVDQLVVFLAVIGIGYYLYLSYTIQKDKNNEED